MYKALVVVTGVVEASVSVPPSDRVLDVDKNVILEFSVIWF